MNKSHPIGACFAFTLCALANTVHATTITMDYTGYVDTSGFAAGITVTGALAWNPGIAGNDTNPDPELGEYLGLIQGLTLNFAAAVGNPATSINGPLDVSGSIALIDNGDLFANLDQYTITLPILNGPTVYFTQTNGFERSATLTEVVFNSGQNTNPIDSTNFDADMFSAFIPQAGAQPQRIFLNWTANQSAPYNVGQTIINFEPTAIDTGVVPVPAAVWLFGSGLLGLVGMARRKKAA